MVVTGKGQLRTLGIYRLYLKRITNKELLQGAWNSAHRYVSAWMGGEFGGEWIHVHV